MKKRQQQEDKNYRYEEYQQQQMQKQIQCNKGKTSKFKRSISNLEDDGASSAILFLACIACTTPSSY
ncbi:uncharacterized protein [Euphorbia lathyris]|uniref:uncharacterized protein n=1 Tax=Euphorbia lathyris TaxID=212925 RepID=UPI0033142A03